MRVSIISVCIVAALALIVSGCKKNSSPEYDNREEETKTEIIGSINVPVAFVGTAQSGYLGEAVASRANKIANSPDEAEVIVVKSSELSANKAVLEKAYNDGKRIVELEPSNASHCAFWPSIGAPAYLDPLFAGNDLILIAVCGHSCYQLQTPYITDVLTTRECSGQDLENCQESGAEDRKDLVNYTSHPLAASYTAEYINTWLNSFVAWANEAAPVVSLSDVPVPAFDGDLSKYITDASRCQHFTKTVNIGADNFEFSHVALSSADKVSRHSSIDLSVYIAPLYSYEMNGSSNSGDYYFVSASMVLHNKPMYDLYKTWHGWVRTWAHIFYSKNFTFDATLLTSGRNAFSNLEFFETPHPTSTVTSTTYTTGFSSALNISGQGGIAGGKPTATLTVGGTFTWSNSQSKTVSDQSIQMSTNPTNRSVHYEFIVQNDREEDSTNDAVPAIARTDQQVDASWCWHVKGTKDDDLSTHYVLKMDMYAIYGYMWRHATWTAEGNRATVDFMNAPGHTTYIDLAVPNRKRNGIVEIKSTNSQYMYGLKILDKSGNVVAKDSGAYEKNAVQRYQIPVGTYNVEYEIRNGDTGESMGNYRISDVEVSTAQTTVKSTIDGKKI